ncbi:uncharacterized protein N7443_006006 [Penicillium atrosanguineum]|uniref:uncharacterized protein n=1 Tax=Penicillium atrosanguineum TaxID=1132637 RepID=UPI002394DCAC|nr:uncharacterized protein N7443_006006 [Penicillium atrosanguineum]KAJ5301004.1 hypothetical protein N7443_006006 [Penicillium atrosanguineum]
MKTFITLAAFAAGTNALVGRGDSCCFHLTASGGASGSIGQLSDGQNRIGDDSLSSADYCINSSGGITDSNGRGCILTSSTTQWQCDEGASPTTGFSIASNGELEYNGSDKFIACETGQNGGMNIYTTNSTSVTQCKNVKLTADSCSGSGAGTSGSSSSAVSSAMSTATPSPAPASSSPAASAPAGSVPASSAPSVSVPAASSAQPSGPASSAECLAGSPVTTTVTVTASDCACATSAPAAGGSGAAGGGSASSSAPAGGAGGSPAPTSSAPAGSVQPSGPAGDVHSTSSVAPAPSGPAGGMQSSSNTAQPSTMSNAAQPSTMSNTAQPSTMSNAAQPSTMSSVAATSASSTASSTSSAGGHCPTTLTSGNYQYPHLIIPVDSSSPDTAAGTSYNGTVSSTISTIFNFDIPSSYSDKTCSLVFLFPKKADLETSSYSFSGDGKIDVSKLSSVATESTDYSNAPSVAQDLGDITISPGNSYVLSTFACPSGEAIAYEMKNAGSTNLNFFEDWNPSPLGLFITTC